jgi:hypothetical protein
MKRVLLLLVCLPFAGACRSHVPAKPEGVAVVIKDTHLHSRYCGHYRCGQHWYFLPQHRHGVDCGHELVDGEWILPE